MSSLLRACKGLFCINTKDKIAKFLNRYKNNKIKILKNYIKPTDVIFEIGSGYGICTTKLASLVPKGKIFAFEPQREIFYCLCANMILNQIKNVEPINYGVSNKTKSFNIKNIQDINVSINSNTEDLASNQDCYQTTSVSLDDFPIKITNVLIINLPAKNILLGTNNLLLKSPIVVTYDKQNQLLDLGYKEKEYDCDGGKLYVYDLRAKKAPLTLVGG
jgi:FkbM family methyltransferase